MSKKIKLAVETKYGTFTRITGTAYKFCVVTVPLSRFGETFTGADELAAKLAGRKSGVMARVLKDRGYLVSWHSSHKAAIKAAQDGNSHYFRSVPGSGEIVEVPGAVR